MRRRRVLCAAVRRLSTSSWSERSGKPAVSGRRPVLLDERRPAGFPVVETPHSRSGPSLKDLIIHRTGEDIFAEHIFARQTTDRLQPGRVDAAVFQRQGIGDVEADDPADDQMTER
jgi:hypothetical protein